MNIWGFKYRTRFFGPLIYPPGSPFLRNETVAPYLNNPYWN